jgi:mRNA interferase YafQ
LKNGFKKGIKRDKKSEKYSQLDFEILKDIIKKLQEKKPIDPIHDIHPLHRPFLGYEAIHIKSDWILVFKIEKPF